MAQAPREIVLGQQPQHQAAPQAAPATLGVGQSQQAPPAGSKGNPHKDQSNQSLAENRAAYEQAAREFGNEDGKGKRAFVSFARKLVEGGSMGPLVVNKFSQDADVLYRAFTEASRKAASNVLSEDNKQSEKVQVAKVKAFIKMGNNYQDDALAIFDRARDLHKELVSENAGQGATGLKYKSTYTSLYTIAVAQCRKVEDAQGKMVGRAPMTREEMREILVVPAEEKPPVTGIDLLIQAMNLIDHAIKGRAETENREGRPAVDHPELPRIHAELRQVIGEKDVDGALAKDDAQKAVVEARKAAAVANRQRKEAEAAAKAAQKKQTSNPDTGDEGEEDEIPEELSEELSAEDMEALVNG